VVSCSKKLHRMSTSGSGLSSVPLERVESLRILDYF
jgi:hypothetical protein